MGLNIKRPAAEEAIRELAEIDGLSLTDAVEVAVREAIERRRDVEEPSRAERQERFARLRAYLDALPPSVRVPECEGGNHDMLYGEDGLPA